MGYSFKGRATFAVVIFVLAVGGHVEARISVRSVEPRTRLISLPRTESESLPMATSRVRREDSSPSSDNGKLLVDFTVLPDEGHNEAIVHWSGNDSQAIFLLTRQRGLNGTVLSSTLYISLDYGSSFQKKVLDHSILLHYFYVCPNNRNKLVFVDLKNKNLLITKDEGSTFKAWPMIKDSDRIVFHPTQEDWFLSYSELDRTLHLTKNLGETWSLVHEMVNPRFYWAVLPSVDTDENIIHMEVEDPTTGEFLYRAVTSPYPKEVVIDQNLGFIEVGSVVVQNEYIFVQRKTPFSNHLYVSYKRGPFQRTHFPRDARPTDFEIVDTEDEQVFIAANHQAGAVTLYLSDATGRFFVKSLENVMAVNRSENFKVDLYEVKGLPGTYLANRPGPPAPETLITFNQGGKWQRIPAPQKNENGTDTNCHLPDCSLYIHLHIDSYFYGIPWPLTEENAPGLILAHGIVETDSRETKFIMSQDGGLTWTIVTNGTYRRSILDQGGAIIAVPFNPHTLDVTQILYSCTEGKSWQKFAFDGRSMKVDGLLNEPGITTLVASLYGHTTTKEEAKAGWMIAKLNFSQILSSPCRPGLDYSCWYPYSGVSSHECLMGQQSCYERRQADIECFNGGDYERAINVTNCTCTDEDFECDFGYELKSDKCVAAAWFDSSVPVEDCEVGTTFRNSSGYRKVASSNCIGNEQHVPVEARCPFIRPRGLQIQVDGREFQPKKSDVVFRVYQERGTKQLTNYSIDFGDGSAVVAVTGLSAIERVAHAFQKTGIFSVTAEASNPMGSASASVKVFIQDNLSGLHVTISHAAEVNKPVVFQAVPLFRYAVSPSAAYNVHYLWLFGTEKSTENGQLAWNSSATYTYSEPGNFTVWIQAFTGVGSASRTMIIPVYGTVTTVQLTLSGLVFPFGLMSTTLEDLIAETLRKALAFELEIDFNRLDVEFSQLMAPIVFVSFLPMHQTMTTDDSISVAVNALFEKVKAKKIVFSLPDEAFGSRSNITVVAASLFPSGDGASASSSRVLGIAIGVPVIIIAVCVSILITVYYKRRLTSLHSYSLLHSRYRAGENLLEDTDDDDPLIIDSSAGGGGGSIRGGTGGGGGGGGSHAQRLMLSDDDDLLGTQILLSNTSVSNRSATADEATNHGSSISC